MEKPSANRRSRDSDAATLDKAAGCFPDKLGGLLSDCDALAVATATVVINPSMGVDSTFSIFPLL
jgi:4'-phosphopantetheinyl transferase EntD